MTSKVLRLASDLKKMALYIGPDKIKTMKIPNSPLELELLLLYSSLSACDDCTDLCVSILGVVCLSLLVLALFFNLGGAEGVSLLLFIADEVDLWLSSLICLFRKAL